MNRHAAGFLMFFLIADTGFSACVNLESPSLYHEYVFTLPNDVAAGMQNVNDFFDIAAKPRSYAFQVASAVFWLGTIGNLADGAFQNEMRSRKSPEFDHVIEPWEAYGGAITPVALALSLYVGGAGFKNRWLHETGRECVMSLSLAALISTTMKITIGRKRPFAEDGPSVYKPFAFENSNRSFPSGHTTSAFALSSVLSARINNPFVSVLLYGAAALTGVQRIYSNNHWFSDVIAGGLIGTVTGRFIVQSSLNTDGEGDLLPVRFTPVVSESATGVGLTYKW